MQKFRSYIYVNENALNDIINQIKDLKLVKQDEKSELQSKTTGGAGIGVAKLEENISSIMSSSYKLRQSDIEDFVTWCEKKGNSLNLNNKRPKYEDKGVIAIFTGKGNLPEQIQDVELIQSIIGNQVLLESMPQMDEENKKIAKMLKQSEKIPIIAEITEDILLNAQIEKKNLKESINSFLEYIEDEFTIICKIENFYEEGKIEIFDIAKEILKINRTVRRRMTEEQLKNVVVYEEAPLIKVMPLIIYR